MIGMDPRRLGSGGDWVQSCEEWSAALVILRAWRRRYARFEEGGWSYMAVTGEGTVACKSLSLVRAMRWREGGGLQMP